MINENIKVKVALKQDRSATGNYEVTINGELVHSKTTRGQGRCETKEEQQAIVDAIFGVLAKAA